MKVLQQLIKHFWQRGALTLEQAHYFVEHGFVQARDLESYEPRDREEDEADTTIIEPLSPTVLLPDELDETEQSLIEPRRRAGKPTAKVPDLEPEQLGRCLEDILAARAEHFPALLELARPFLTQPEEREAAVVLRQLDEKALHARLLDVVQNWPSILGALWECVDDLPFQDFVEQPGVKGRAVRAFQTVLCSAVPGQWGSAAWILQVPAVQTVANLLAVRRRLRQAIMWLYEQHWVSLGRCLQRPARPKRSWDGFGFGLVLLYNARARFAQRPPSGFVLEKRLTTAGWREAWTTAVALEPAAVTPYFIHVFGSVHDLSDAEVENLSAREDVELICPSGWKV